LTVWAVVILCAALLIGVAATVFRHSELKSPEDSPILATVPDFHFTTQDGKPLSRADLLGKVWVVDFIFTRCPGPCPMMTSKLAEVSRELSKADDVRLVSISIDPEHDTPEVLREYASRYQADLKHWIFLTGPKEDIDKFTKQGMLQVLARDPAGVPTHSTRFLLIDREGRLRKLRHLEEPEVVEKLLMDIGGLLRDSTPKETAPNGAP
jgi:protein SCO1/2